MASVTAPKGTADILPRDSYKWQYLEGKIRDICARFNFSEIRTPVFEHTEVFERGVINVFRGLNRNYKTNSPCKFGSKIIVNNLVRWDRWGFHLISGMQADRLADLERMLHLLSGKPIPDNRGNITINLDDHIRSVQGKERYEDEMFIIKYFKKGSAHITFKRLELIDRINDIIARHFPSVLSA